MIEIIIRDRRTGRVQRLYGTTGIVLTRLDDDVTVAAVGDEDQETVCGLLEEAREHVASVEEGAPPGYAHH